MQLTRTNTAQLSWCPGKYSNCPLWLSANHSIQRNLMSVVGCPHTILATKRVHLLIAILAELRLCGKLIGHWLLFHCWERKTYCAKSQWNGERQNCSLIWVIWRKSPKALFSLHWLQAGTGSPHPLLSCTKAWDRQIQKSVQMVGVFKLDQGKYD